MDEVKKRIDQLLVSRGLVESRAKAQAAIQAGGVAVDGGIVRKPGALVDEAAALHLEPAHPFVSRGGVKLAFALDSFGIEPAGRACLDVGASTGGFSQVLLMRGAGSVLAVDVGRGQMHESLRKEPRLTVLEARDARSLTPADFSAPPSLIVADVSFIGLDKAMPAALACAAPAADLVALVKPQFESGPGVDALKLSEAKARAIAEAAVARLDGASGFRRRGLIDSPILGGAGAREFLYWATRA